MLKIFRSCPSRLRSCAHLCTHQQPWGHYPDTAHTCKDMTLNMQESAKLLTEHMRFLISSGIPLICPLMLKWLSIVKGVSYRPPMITQMVSVLHWAAVGGYDFIFSFREGETQQPFSCNFNAPRDCEMFFEMTVWLQQKSLPAWLLGHRLTSWLIGCSCSRRPTSSTLVCFLVSKARGDWVESQHKLWNHIFRQDRMVSVSASNMTAWAVTPTVLFPALLLWARPRHGISVVTHPSTILILLFTGCCAANIAVCHGDNWDGPYVGWHERHSYPPSISSGAGSIGSIVLL